MAVNLSAIKDLLVPGLRKVTGEYKDLPKIYDKIFDVGSSKRQVERVASMRYLGIAALKADGGATKFDNAEQEMYVYNQKHIGVGIGYAIARNAIDDNLYKAQFRPSNLGLMMSVSQYKEIVGANILNNGTTFDANVGGDGVALFSTSHPISNGGLIANRPSVDVDLNESTLLAAQTAIRGNFRDNAGLRMQARARKLVVPLELEPVAIRLIKTELRPGTADNDVNAILSTSGGIPEGCLFHDYLTSKYAWFLLSDQPGLQYLQRIPFETDMQVDFITDNLLVKAFERFSFSYYDFRAAYGSFPTS
jgi:hypothetical protein